MTPTGHPSSNNYSTPDGQEACCHHAVMMSQEHCVAELYRPDAIPVTQPTASKH